MSVDILTRIVEYKKAFVREAQASCPEFELRQKAQQLRTQRPFRGKLQQPGVNIIAEIKRASPSKGTIRADLDSAEYAAAYEDGGAAALSVLTDEAFFSGHLNDLALASKASRLPVLRKDFIVSTYQLYESAVWRADAVLLIVRILSRTQLAEFLALCDELSLDALVEVHTLDELQRAQQTGARLIGINNRNLRSFETSIDTAVAMARHLESDQIAVAESGIHSREDIQRLLAAGFWNFLIGEGLVRAADPRKALKRLLKPLSGPQAQDPKGRCIMPVETTGSPPRSREKGQRAADRTTGSIQVKVCGLKDPHQAYAIAAMGVQAIGCVFYPKSPRHLTLRQARIICQAVGERVHKVGVFVNAIYDDVMRTAETCGLSAVQLHGQETPELVARLRQEPLVVIKALFHNGTPSFSVAADYAPSAFLVECGQGPLPGGNAMQWDWSATHRLGDKYPLILAGGLTPDNIQTAVACSRPDAVDVSSGVESAPGDKDLARVQAFIRALDGAKSTVPEKLKPIF